MDQHQLKVLVLGDAGVGKTSLLNRFVKRDFSQKYRSTIGADFLSKELQIGNELISLQVWDTAGQERYHALGAAFYRGADCCILVYDITSLDSFEHLPTWQSTFLEQSNPTDPQHFPFVIVGNKSDESESRAVDIESAEKWTRDLNSQHFEVSAKDNINVDQLFEQSVLLALERQRQPQPQANPVKLSRTRNSKKKRCC